MLVFFFTKKCNKWGKLCVIDAVMNEKWKRCTHKTEGLEVGWGTGGWLSLGLPRWRLSFLLKTDSFCGKMTVFCLSFCETLHFLTALTKLNITCQIWWNSRLLFIIKVDFFIVEKSDIDNVDSVVKGREAKWDKENDDEEEKTNNKEEEEKNAIIPHWHHGDSIA